MHLISIRDFSKDKLLTWVEEINQYDQNLNSFFNCHPDKVIALAFFEPSTRTTLSFSAAAQRLGARVIGFNDASSSSTVKGETLEDTIQVCASFSNAIVMRHPQEGAAYQASKVSEVPIINGGDGGNEHPTQTLLDLYTISKHFDLEAMGNKHFLIAGDIARSRTINSLTYALAKLKANLTFVEVGNIKLKSAHRNELEALGAKIDIAQGYSPDLVKSADVVYCTRIQKERWPLDSDLQPPIFTQDLLEVLPKTSIVMSPLPRLDELPSSLDHDPRVIIFNQVKNGVPTRMMILEKVLEA